MDRVEESKARWDAMTLEILKECPELDYNKAEEIGKVFNFNLSHKDIERMYNISFTPYHTFIQDTD